jgi:hypothetical protein
MLDLSKLDLSNVIYFDDQRYMEDYLLTLQLLTRDNCDWDSLKENHYIGDYIHSSDRNHTLALTTVREREMLLASSEYMLCLKRINDMRRSVRARAPI